MKVRQVLPATIVTLSLTFTGITTAVASTATHSTGVKAARTAGIEMLETLDAAKITTINSDIAKSGATGTNTLPADAVAFGFNANGDAVAVDAAGEETVLETASVMDAEIEAA